MINCVILLELLNKGFHLLMVVYVYLYINKLYMLNFFSKVEVSLVGLLGV